MQGGSLQAEQGRPTLAARPVDGTRARPRIGPGTCGGEGALVAPDEPTMGDAESLQRGDRGVEELPGR